MNSLAIRTKLMILAGVPVLGALVLAAIIAQGARTQATAAAALGSVDDVAQLSTRIGVVLHELQLERARVAHAMGAAARRDDPANLDTFAASSELAALTAAKLPPEYDATDASLSELEHFLSGRDLSKLPGSLASDLRAARREVALLPAFRERIAHENVSLESILAAYEAANDNLISATGALTQLSDDGQLLRPISSLVALEELTERVSQQHALLSYVFAVGQFPPGAYKNLVTLMTAQSVFAESFLENAAEAAASHYERSQKSVAVQAARAMRTAALTTTEEAIVGDSSAWFSTEALRLTQLGGVEQEILGAISSAATRKMSNTRASIHTSIGLSAVVVVASVLLAWLIARGITRTVEDLSSAAERVRETKDFSIRARKTSSDELGMLTLAFNEMLTGIQARDTELEIHRTNLEALVDSRTAELVSRNEAMRLVLDNIDRGLATFAVDGTMNQERSAHFDAWFGSPKAGASFAEHLAADDTELRAAFELGWGQIVDDVLPEELTVDQMPKRTLRDGRHLTFSFKLIKRNEKLEGALVVVSDVTAEVEARIEQEKQREHVAVFERVMQDRDGFVEFAVETNRLFGQLAEGVSAPSEALLLIHTVKGNTAQWGLASVARIAHEIESELIDSREMPGSERLQAMFDSWEGVANRFRSILVETNARVFTRTEVDMLLDEIQTRIPHEEILRRIEHLKHEATVTRFERMRSDVERLAKRLNKPCPLIVIESNDVRLPASRFAGFWSSMVHVVRNMLDHGLESAEERLAARKTERGTIVLRSVEASDSFRLEFSDDGRGIDWDKVRDKARAMGLPTETLADLTRALFVPGLSTAQALTDISGRGVGLSAVAGHCEALGGTVSVESTRGKGTTFAFSFPRRGNEHSIVPPGRPWLAERSLRTSSRRTGSLLP